MYNNYKITVQSGFSVSASSMVKSLHYTKSLARGCNKVYSLFINNELMGVAAFGSPVGRNCQNYSISGKPVIELKRFVLSPLCLHNTASWFMGKLIKFLKEYDVDSVLSYSDPFYNHDGCIYKASNFKHLGIQKWSTVYVEYEGKKYQNRQVYQDTKIGKALRLALKTKEIEKFEMPKKNIFLYKLSK